MSGVAVLLLSFSSSGLSGLIPSSLAISGCCSTSLPSRSFCRSVIGGSAGSAGGLVFFGSAFPLSAGVFFEVEEAAVVGALQGLDLFLEPGEADLGFRFPCGEDHAAEDDLAPGVALAFDRSLLHLEEAQPICVPLVGLRGFGGSLLARFLERSTTTGGG